MLRCIETRSGTSLPHGVSRIPAENLLQRGYHAVYHRDEINHCPGCGRTHWHVGRLSAECGFCAAALPLADTGMTGIGLLHRPRLDEAA